MGLLPETMDWEMEDDDGLLCMGSERKRGSAQVEKRERLVETER